MIEGGSSNLKDIKAGNYRINKLCLEPTSFTVKEESQFKGGEAEFTPTKLMTRLTYTLDEVPSPAHAPASCIVSCPAFMKCMCIWACKLSLHLSGSPTRLTMLPFGEPEESERHPSVLAAG